MMAMKRKTYRLLDKVQEFCMSRDFEDQFDNFALKHVHLFLPALDSSQNQGDSEHSLCHHDCFTEYLSHFEGKLKSFIEENNNDDDTVEDFYEQCQNALEKLPPFHEKRFFIEALLSTTDYTIFHVLMVGQAREIRAKNQREAAADDADDARSRK